MEIVYSYTSNKMHSKILTPKTSHRGRIKKCSTYEAQHNLQINNSSYFVQFHSFKALKMKDIRIKDFKATSMSRLSNLIINVKINLCNSIEN